MPNKWGDRNATTGKLTADQLQYRADVKLMVWAVALMVLVMVVEIVVWNS